MSMRDKMPLQPPLPPMEARSAEQIPAGTGWQYEPKWDGFRCIAFREGEEIYLRSKAGQPLARYFPDIADALADVPETYFVLDGELIIPHKWCAFIRRIATAASSGG
jgi:ATP-dependent DNA ligase